MLEDEKAKAQQTLDEIWAEHGIPFKLTAHKVEVGEPNYYKVHFLDSRFPLVFFYQYPEESFCTAFRRVVECTVGRRGRGKGVDH